MRIPPRLVSVYATGSGYRPGSEKREVDER